MKKSLGLFGIGRWGKNIARNFFELDVLNSVYDPCVENINKKNLKGVLFCKNEDEIFENPNIDKVAIVTRIPEHARLIIKALKANKDVFVEKPICFDLNEAKLIKKIAKEKNKIVMIGHILHYHPVVIKLKELLQQGIIGDLVSINSIRQCFGYIKEEKNSLWSLATHDISLILSILKSMPKAVFALTNGMYNMQNDDIYNCFLNFSNDIKAHIKVNWLNPYKEQKFIITGTKGMLLFEDTAKWEEKLKIFHKSKINKNCEISNKLLEKFINIKIAYEEPLKNECKCFLHCCENKIEPLTNIEESINVIEIIKALLNSKDKTQYFSLIKDSFFESSCNLIGKQKNFLVDNAKTF